MMVSENFTDRQIATGGLVTDDLFIPNLFLSNFSAIYSTPSFDKLQILGRCAYSPHTRIKLLLKALSGIDGKISRNC